MGGFGSGQWLREGPKKRLTSELPYIHVRDLKAQQLLVPGSVGVIKCRADEPDCALLVCRAFSNAIRLEYEANSLEHGTSLFTRVVEWDFTACNFGGRRAWFKCPECHSRSAILYVEERKLRCRKCCKLAYRTQGWDEFDRCAYRAQKIRKKLGSAVGLKEPFPQKPKNMHYRTYWRLIKKAVNAEHRFWSLLEKGVKAAYPKPSLISLAQNCAAEQLYSCIGRGAFRSDHANYTCSPEQNLVPGLSRSDFWEDLQSGDGSELEDGPRGPAKFCAAYSSSALAVNTFGPFRHRPQLLNIEGITGFNEAQFEKKLPTGLGGTPPNLDFFASGDKQALCVESKFLEPLWLKAAKFAKSYERAIESLAEESWAAMYRQLKTNPAAFRHLDAAQLVKHYLGIRKTLGAGGRSVTFLYVYWEPSNADDIAEFQRHRREVEYFADAVNGAEVNFKYRSYPQLWDEWETAIEWEALAPHLASVRKRYSFEIV